MEMHLHAKFQVERTRSGLHIEKAALRLYFTNKRPSPAGQEVMKAVLGRSKVNILRSAGISSCPAGSGAQLRLRTKNRPI